MGRKTMTSPTEKLTTPLAVREEMFQHWMQHDNKSETARLFKINRATITRIANREGWTARRIKIMADVEASANRDMTKDIFSNIDTVKIIRRGVATKLMKRLDQKSYRPSLRDFVLIMELEEKMAGNIPSDPQSHVVNIFNKLPEPKQDQLALDTAKVRDAIKQRNSRRMS